MIENLSYNSKKIKDLLIDMVGKPLSLYERFKMGGNGSDKLIITDASNDIVELLKLDNNINQCNIEIRSNGIIIRFRALLETYGLPVFLSSVVRFTVPSPSPKAQSYSL